MFPGSDSRWTNEIFSDLHHAKSKESNTWLFPQPYGPTNLHLRYSSMREAELGRPTWIFLVVICSSKCPQLLSLPFLENFPWASRHTPSKIALWLIRDRLYFVEHSFDSMLPGWLAEVCQHQTDGYSRIVSRMSHNQSEVPSTLLSARFRA